MPFEIVLALASFSFVSSITPGPNNLMLLASGVNYGFARTLPHMLGISGGFCFLLLCVGFGLGQILQAAPMLYTALKFAGAAYLIYLAWRIATSSPMDSNIGKGRPMTFLEAAAFQWVNPKAWTMAIGAITVYAPGAGRDPNVGQGALLWVAVAFLCMGMVSTTLWVTLGQQVRRWLGTHRRLRVFNVTMATLMVLSMGYALTLG